MTKKMVSLEGIENKIFSIRGKKIMIDRDLAQLYGVETKYLTRQVRRNIRRFPEEFMFRLSLNEKNELVTNWRQFRTLKHSYSPPYAFTEHGVAMLSSILNSEAAIRISVSIIKTFIKLRELIARQNELSGRIAKLEQKIGDHDEEITALFKAIHELMREPEKTKREIGFHAK